MNKINSKEYVCSDCLQQMQLEKRQEKLYKSIEKAIKNEFYNTPSKNIRSRVVSILYNQKQEFVDLITKTGKFAEYVNVLTTAVENLYRNKKFEQV